MEVLRDACCGAMEQIKGRKRMLFYPPSELRSLKCYPNWHLLRRRARFNPADPQPPRFPRASAFEPTVAVLEPGDVLFFPPFWAHYTESRDLSISMTYRFRHRIPHRPWPGTWTHVFKCW